MPNTTTQEAKHPTEPPLSKSEPFQCRLMHGAIDATLQLHSSVPEGDRAGAKIEVGLPEVFRKDYRRNVPNKVEPKDLVDEQFSVYFQVASAVTEGNVTLDSYKRLNDASVIAIMKSTTLVECISGGTTGESVGT